MQESKIKLTNFPRDSNRIPTSVNKNDSFIIYQKTTTMKYIITEIDSDLESYFQCDVWFQHEIWNPKNYGFPFSMPGMGKGGVSTHDRTCNLTLTP